MNEQALRVLLLDDEKSLREPLAEYLRKNCEYLVDTAADAIEAMRLVEEAQGRYDVALIDEVLEEGPSGLEVLQQLKAKYPDIEVIVFTGWGMDSAFEALRAGAYRYFAKPLNLEELALTIRLAAEQGQTRRERKILAVLQQVSAAINSSLDLNEILRRTCQAAVELFGVDHSGLVLFESDLSEGKAIAEHPDRETLGIKRTFGTVIPVRGVPAEERLVYQKEVLNIPDVANEESLGPVREILLSFGIRSVLIVPVILQDKVVASFSLDAIRQPRTFYPSEIELCKSLADQVAVAIGNARLFAAEARRRQEAETLREAALALTTTLEQKEIFEQILRGLQKVVPYDSASVQLLKGDRLEIIGGRGFPDFSDLLGLSFPVKGDNPNREVVRRKAPFIVPDAPAVYRVLRREPHAHTGIRSWLGVPMLVGDRFIGMIALDKREPAFYTDEHARLALAFATQAALAVENARLYQNAEEGRAYIQSLYESSSAIISPRGPDQVLQNIVETACQSTGAWSVVILLMDESEHPRILASYGLDQQLDALSSTRETGVSKQVLRSGQARFIPDTGAEAGEVHPAMLEQGVKATACLPLPLMGNNIGVLWIHFRDKHPFSETEQHALQLYANQSAIAYDNARRMQLLEHMRMAADAMARAAGVKEVLQQIVKSAREVLSADYALIWSYDAVRDVFFPQELVAGDVSTEWLERYRQLEPKTGKTTRRVLDDGYVQVTDLSTSQADFLDDVPTREFLQAMGVHSFQGIRLDVGSEKLGVLFADYKNPRGFGAEDRNALETFANHAALALKKARLLDQVHKARDAAAVVAQVVALGKDVKSTLSSVVAGAQEALSCDAVTLYRFNEDSKEPEHPPTMIGVKYRERVTRLPSVSRDSIVWKTLESNNLIIVEDTASDPLTSERRFTLDEGIKSLVGIPLRVRDRRVGVMFVNYRNRHRFTDDELTNIRLFANQAAVAIRNAQLYDQVQSRATALQSLYEAGQIITSSLELNEILNRIAEQAWNLAGQAGFANIRLVEGMKTKVVASYPREALARTHAILGEEIDLTKETDGRIGVTGRAVMTKESQLVGDVTRDPDYLESHPDTRSELAAPIKAGGRVVGVIDVRHPDLNAFDEELQHTLESLAAQAAVAILNARLHDLTRKRAEVLRGLYEAGRTITATLTLEETLSRITEQALRIVVGGRQQEGCFSYLALLEGNKLRFVAASPPEILSGLQQDVGEIYLALANGQQIGITGRAAKTGQSWRVGVASKDSDYIPFGPHINSQLSVPIKIGDQAIGVISIEHPAPNAFSTEDERNVELLAAQAAVAIQNARRYGKTQRLLEAHTALAWTGMVSSIWRHAIDKHAITIREQIQLLRRELVRLPESDPMAERLNMIERLANRILEKPITPPLSVEEGVQSVQVNALIRERTKQLWSNEPYKSVLLSSDLALGDSATTRASPEWLRRALDVLIDNAVEATAGLPERKIALASRQVDDRARISVTDNGRGVPEEICGQIFRKPIKKLRGAKGLGMGLLFAQTIVQTYGGDIQCYSTGPTGTAMIISLPLEA